MIFNNRYIGELSEEQTKTLQDFKKWMKDENLPDNPWYTDSQYVRFLRCQKFDLEKVKEQWLKYMEYRKEYDIDNIMTVSKL